MPEKTPAPTKPTLEDYLQRNRSGALLDAVGPLNPGPAPAPAPGRVGPAPQRPAGPTVALGGLDLAGLADQGMAETQTRIGGQGALIDSYLSSVLGEQAAQGQAATERDLRLQDFRRNQALLEAALDERRRGQESSLQSARIKAASGDARADRDFAAAQAAQQRIFELGTIAGGAEQPQGNNFGSMYIGADRGATLDPETAAAIKGRTYTEQKGGGGITLPKMPSLLGIGGGGQIRLGGSKPRSETTTYEDLLNQAYDMQSQYGEDPNEMQRRILELFKRDPEAASLALHDIGYYPQAYLGQG